jgi:hypothetical protein
MEIASAVALFYPPCKLCQTGLGPAGAAIEHGFIDFDQMRALFPVRISRSQAMARVISEGETVLLDQRHEFRQLHHMPIDPFVVDHRRHIQQLVWRSDTDRGAAPGLLPK